MENPLAGHWLNSDTKSEGIDYDVVPAKVRTCGMAKTFVVQNLLLPPDFQFNPGLRMLKINKICFWRLFCSSSGHNHLQLHRRDLSFRLWEDF